MSWPIDLARKRVGRIRVSGCFVISKKRLLLLSGLLLSSTATATPTSTVNLEVKQIGTYQYATTHYVWFSQVLPGCTFTPHFDETSAGGKALLATLNIALINGRKVDVQHDGCDLIEVYLK